MDSFVAIHKHLIIRAEVDTPPITTTHARHILMNTISIAGMTCISGPHAERVDAPGNEGVTAVAILAESHCAMHVWDAVSPALIQFDLYSCAEFDVGDIISIFEKFDIVKLEYKLLDREHGLTIAN